MKSEITNKALASLSALWKRILQRKAMHIVFANVAEGTHTGNQTRTLENALTARHLLVKQGTDVNEVDICGASDLPLGTCTDEGVATDQVNIALLGSADSTRLMVASESIAAGLEVYTAASGKISKLSATPGDYYRVGVTLGEASGNGALVEVDPYPPVKITV